MSSWKYLFSLFTIMMVALPVQADEVQQRIFEENLKRAETGDANSQFIVGHRYEIGVGTQNNIEKAFEWYSKAAQKGHPLALFKTEMRCCTSSACTGRTTIMIANRVNRYFQDDIVEDPFQYQLGRCH